MAALLPRLSAAAVHDILGKYDPAPPPVLDEATALSQHQDKVSYAASGGSKAPGISFAIGKELRRLAGNFSPPTQSLRAQFDQEAAIFLAEHPALQHGEALRNDVWAFIATIAAPDIVAWRFPTGGAARFTGGVRNAFQRLWLRGKALDRGSKHPQRWLLVRNMPEDAAVQIVERPSLAGRPRIAKAIGEGWLEMSLTTPQGVQESVMRAATKILRIQNQIQDLEFLSEDQLAKAVRHAFTRARASL